MKWIIIINGKEFELSIWVRYIFGNISIKIGEGKRDPKLEKK